MVLFPIFRGFCVRQRLNVPNVKPIIDSDFAYSAFETPVINPTFQPVRETWPMLSGPAPVLKAYTRICLSSLFN